MPERLQRISLGFACVTARQCAKPHSAELRSSVGRFRTCEQFQDVLILILFVAAAISFVVGETTDALGIVAISVLNAVLGFVQEWKTE